MINACIIEISAASQRQILPSRNGIVSASGNTTKYSLKYVLVTVSFDALKLMMKWISIHDPNEVRN